LQKWIKKLGVKHFSEKLMLSKLFESGTVRYIADLYHLTVSELTRFEGVKEKSAQKALNNLYSVKTLPLERFIAGFDIESIGERMVRKIVNSGYDTLDKIRASSVSELSIVEGFAEITAQYLLDGIDDLYPQMQDVVSTQRITIQEGKKAMAGNLAGKSFCFTGKLDTMTRAQAEQLVAENGGDAKKSVVKNLTYLVANSTEQTVKLKKAQEQGTEIITEQEFLDMVE
jgi:DNA ligase (NAD+)